MRRFNKESFVIAVVTLALVGTAVILVNMKQPHVHKPTKPSHDTVVIPDNLNRQMLQDKDGNITIPDTTPIEVPAPAPETTPTPDPQPVPAPDSTVDSKPTPAQVFPKPQNRITSSTPTEINFSN